MKRISLVLAALLAAAACSHPVEDLKLNDLGYFERQGVNVLVFNNPFTGGFNDEKDSGIEIIHHGVRTFQGGAVRLGATPEQWDLVPKMTDRVVDTLGGSIEVGLRYDDYDFDSRVTVRAKGKAVEISVFLDKPVPEKLVGEAGFMLEFLPSQYWSKAYLMDGRPNRIPRYAVSDTKLRPNEEKVLQFHGYRTYDDRGTGMFIEPLPLETGHELLLAPDTPERMVKVTSEDALLQLYDGRMLDPMLYSLILREHDWKDFVQLRAVIDIGTLHVALRGKNVAAIVPILRKILEAMRKEFDEEQPDIDRILDMDLRFHNAIASSINNPQINTVNDYISRLSLPSRLQSIEKWIRDGKADTFIELHSEIVDVIEKRDVSRIEQVIEAHYIYWRIVT